jgi:hypothetical protein
VIELLTADRKEEGEPMERSMAKLEEDRKLLTCAIDGGEIDFRGRNG